MMGPVKFVFMNSQVRAPVVGTVYHYGSQIRLNRRVARLAVVVSGWWWVGGVSLGVRYRKGDW